MLRRSPPRARDAGRTICSVKLIRTFGVSAPNSTSANEKHLLTELIWNSSRLSEVTQELTALQKKLAEKSNEDSQQAGGALAGGLAHQDGNEEALLDDGFYFMSSLQDLPHPTPYLGDIELKPDQVVALLEQ